MEELMSRCRNSMGFSSVTTCFWCVWLMWFTIAAIVELFPEPVPPVTRTKPRSAAAIVVRMDGSLSDSNVGMSNGITRITIMNDERCRRMLMRKRPTPGTPHEQSYSCSLSSRPRSSSFGIRRNAIARVCSGVSRCLVRGTSLPSIRARNTSPALMCKSDAPRSIAALMIFSIPSVPGLQVHHVEEGRPCKIATNVLHDESRLPFPETVRHSRRVRTDQDARVSPERMPRRERLVGENVQRRAPEAARVEQLEQRGLVQQIAPRHVDDDRRGGEARQHVAAHGGPRQRGARRRDHEHVGLGGQPRQG